MAPTGRVQLNFLVVSWLMGEQQRDQNSTSSTPFVTTTATKYLEKESAQIPDVQLDLFLKDTFPIIMANDTMIRLVENSLLTNVVAGLSYISVATVGMLIYIPCIIVFYREVATSVCYVLLISLGMSDLIQLIGVGIIPGMITLSDVALPLWANKLLGGFSMLGWTSFTAICHILALSRFVFVCTEVKWQNNLFGKVPTTLWICLSWAWGLFCFGLLNFPEVGMPYTIESYSYFYDIPDGRLQWNSVMRTVIFCQNCLWLIPSGLWYMAIIIATKLEKKKEAKTATTLLTARKSLTPSRTDLRASMGKLNRSFRMAREAGPQLLRRATGQGLSKAETQRKIMQRERALMRNAATIYCFGLFVSFYWYVTTTWFAGFHPKKVFYSCNMLWILNGSVSPVIYLIFNEEIRVKVFQLLHLPTGSSNNSRATERISIPLTIQYNPLGAVRSIRSSFGI